MVTVFNDARTLLESVIEHEFVGIRTHGAFEEVQGAWTGEEEEEQQGRGFIDNKKVTDGR